MNYRFWVFQDGIPPSHVMAGNRRAPKPTDPIPNDLLHPGREVQGAVETIDQITQVFRDHGVADELEIAMIQGNAAEALLERGAYRTTLPTPGRWLLAEKIQNAEDALNGKVQT